MSEEWLRRGIISAWEYAVIINHISEKTFGATTRDHKVPKSLDEHYTAIEHALINLSEAAAHEFTVQRDSHGFERIQQDAIDGGQVGGRARADLESQGLTVVSKQNYLKPPEQKQLSQHSLFDEAEE